MDDAVEGYLDGRDLTSPLPSENRSATYRHSWEVGRRERKRRHWSAPEARRRWKDAVEAERQRHEANP